jgi:DNA-binding XRE family transcriptional regulator
MHGTAWSGKTVKPAAAHYIRAAGIIWNNVWHYNKLQGAVMGKQKQLLENPGAGDDPEVLQLRTRIGEALRAARRATGLTQVQVAERTGLSQQTVSVIERGAHSPTLTSLVLLTRTSGFMVDIVIRPLPG